MKKITEKVTIIAERWDLENKTHYSINWGADNKYFSKLCGISDGLSINSESLLLILNKTIVNYNIVAVLRLDNSHNQNQATINKIKKQLDYYANCKGFDNIQHCDGEPNDIVLSDNHMQIYEKIELTQQLDDNIASLKSEKENLEREINILKATKNNYTETDVDKFTVKVENLKERYYKGQKVIKQQDAIIKTQQDTIETQKSTIKRQDEVIYIKNKQIEQKNSEISEKENFIEKYYPMLKTLKEHKIDNKTLKSMLYERDLNIAKSNF